MKRESTTGSQDAIRIAWTIGDKTGHGPWHDPSRLAELTSHVDARNAEYGKETHRIQFWSPWTTDANVESVEEVASIG